MIGEKMQSCRKKKVLVTGNTLPRALESTNIHQHPPTSTYIHQHTPGIHEHLSKIDRTSIENLSKIYRNPRRHPILGAALAILARPPRSHQILPHLARSRHISPDPLKSTEIHIFSPDLLSSCPRLRRFPAQAHEHTLQYALVQSYD